MTRDAWLKFYGDESPSMVRAVNFTLDFLSLVSGLDVRQLRPHDRLAEDLDLQGLSRGNWDFDFYEEFQREYGHPFDVSLAPTHDATVEEWIRVVARAAATHSPLGG